MEGVLSEVFLSGRVFVPPSTGCFPEKLIEQVGQESKA